MTIPWAAIGKPTERYNCCLSLSTRALHAKRSIGIFFTLLPILTGRQPVARSGRVDFLPFEAHDTGCMRAGDHPPAMQKKKQSTSYPVSASVLRTKHTVPWFLF